MSLAYCVRHGTLLLYGDAVAHLHIARRVFDSLTPGFRQLGSVWLPLPHILLLPFVWNMAWWRNGLAGACISIPSYVLGCAGMYRLARMWLSVPAAIVVVAFYGLNPGLLYMATTAMNEPLFLAEMIWAVLTDRRSFSVRRTSQDFCFGPGWCWSAPFSPAMTDGFTRRLHGCLQPGRCSRNTAGAGEGPW